LKKASAYRPLHGGDTSGKDAVLFDLYLRSMKSTNPYFDSAFIRPQTPGHRLSNKRIPFASPRAKLKSGFGWFRPAVFWRRLDTFRSIRSRGLPDSIARNTLPDGPHLL